MKEEVKKKFMFVMQRPPHGSIYAYEGLEFILISGAYDQDISLLFVGDGVFTLKKDQDTQELGIKGFVKTFRSMEGYDIEKVYVDNESLIERGLKIDDLIIDVDVKKSDEIKILMEEQDVLFPC